MVCSASMLDVLPRADIATILGTLLAGLRHSQQRKSSALAQNVWSQTHACVLLVLVRFNCDDNMSPPQVTSSVGHESDGAARWNAVHFWWGSVSLINAPVMVVLFAGGIILLPKQRDPAPGPWDPPSVGLSLVGMLGLVYAVKEGLANGLLRVDIAMVGVVGAAALTLFVRRQITLPIPLIDIRLLANRAFSGAVAGPERPSTESRLACVAAAIAGGRAAVECSARS